MNSSVEKPRRRRSQVATTTRASQVAWLKTLDLEAFLFWSFLVTLAALPLFYGGNRDWAWGGALTVISVLSIVSLWTLPVIDRLKKVGIHRRRPWFLLLLGAWLLLHVAHLVVPGMSVDRAASLRALLKTSLYMQLLLLALVLVHTRHRARALLNSLFFIAVAHAVIASVMKLWGTSVVTSYFVLGAANSIGSFVNENSFAGYLELHLALGAGLLLMGLKSRGAVDQTWRQLLRDWVAVLLKRKTQVRICMVLMVIALVLTSSRMGNVAFFAALLGTGILAFLLMPNRPPALGALLVSLVLIDLVVIGSWFGADQIAARLSVTRIELATEQLQGDNSAKSSQRVDETPQSKNEPLEIDRERPGLARAGLRLFQRAPWFGNGAGSFRSLFPGVRSTDISNKFYDHAHNDYVQLLAEYGVVGAALAFSILFLALLAAGLCLRRRTDKVALGLAFAGMFGVSSLLIHGVADFNFQIPANAAVFSVLVALAWASRYGFREVASPS